MSSCDPEKFVGRNDELEFIKNKVVRLAKGTPFAANERVVHLIGPSAIGKSCLLEKSYRIFNDEPKYVPILIRLDSIKSERDRFTHNFLVELNEKFYGYQNLEPDKINGSLSKNSDALIKNISKLSENKDYIVILLLDEMNLPPREIVQEMEEYLLYKLLYGNKRVVLVTAGRTHPMLNDFALRPSSNNTILLSPFDETTTAEQAEKLKPASGLAARKLQELGGGIPGNTTRLVDYLEGEPLTIPDELQAVQSLRASDRYNIDERFTPVIEAICILSEFEPDDTLPLLECHPRLGGKWPITRMKDVLTELKKVQVGPGGLINWDRGKKCFVMDESVRRVFEQELQLRDPGLWRKLHCTAYRMYKDWGEEFDSDLFWEKSTYHLKRLTSAGMDCVGLEEEG